MFALGCSRSALEPFDPAPTPAPSVTSEPWKEPPVYLPACAPVDESLVLKAVPAVPCTEPPLASTVVQEVADQGASLTLASDSCGRHVVGSVDSGDVRIGWSIDGAQTIGKSIVVGLGHRPAVIMDGKGAAHLFFTQDKALEHVVQDNPDGAFVSEKFSEGGVPTIAGAEPIMHRAVARRGIDEVALTWDTNAEIRGVWFASTRLQSAFQEPIRIHGISGSFSSPRLCLAGRDRVVIVWRTPGHDQQVFAAISDDGGASFCGTTLGQESSKGADVGENVDVACTPDGRAIAVWDGDDGVRVAALSRAGIWSPSNSIVPGDAYYPHVWIAEERALVTWIGGGQAFGYALVDLLGNLVGSHVWAPDLNFDGQPDRLMRACARDDGFVLLTQGHFSYNAPQATGPAVMTFVDLNGTPALFEEIAPYGATGVDVAMECNPTGAVAVWADAGTVTLARWVK